MGPLVEGADEDTIYSVHGQPRSFSPDRKGEITIPKPSYRAVVRAAARFNPRSASADFTGPRSANVLLDDSTVAGGVLTLVVQEVAPVEFTWTPRLVGSTAEVHDGVGAIVARGSLGSEARWRVKLLPASYLLTAKGPDGREAARTDFRVDPGGATVAVQ
jgi:hypothetical protein